MMKLYKAIDVWERRDNRTVVRYRCFESLAMGKFSVQSADFYHSDDRVGSSDRQFIELFMDDDPETRSGSYDSLVDAVAAHKREFS